MGADRWTSIQWCFIVDLNRLLLCLSFSENQYSSFESIVPDNNEREGAKLKRNLRPIKELENEIEQACETISEGYDFFNYIKGFDFGAKDVISAIHVDKYDELTKDYDGLQFYVAFKKRSEMIHNLNYAKSLEEETYEDYLAGFSEEDFSDELTLYPLSEPEFNEEKSSNLDDELYPVSVFLEKIFFGDPIAITKEDMKYLNHWVHRTGVVSMDIARIAFLNRYNGFMGGMKNKEYNEIISKVILSDAPSELLKSVREIPVGYGWESDGLNRNTIWAEVDLSVPDEILVEGFKNWLVHARGIHATAFGENNLRKEVKNHFKLSFLKRWKSLRVLAYLDMKILSSFFNQSPTLKQYGDALYFDEYDVDTTEKVRKTLLPLVQEILDGNCLEDLLRKIIAEEKVPK